MSEYWKSTPKYWCKHCKTFVKDTKLEKTNHDASPKHQGNIKRFLRDLHHGHEREERDKQRAKDEVARLNRLIPSGPTSEGAAVTGAGGAGSILGAPWRRAAAAPTGMLKATPGREQQLAQLAEMGVAVPEEFRKEVAMAGEWQTLSETPLDEVTGERIKKEEGEGDFKPEGLNVGVRKRKFLEDLAEEEAEVRRNVWGSTTKSYPGPKGGEQEEDLNTLLGKTKMVMPTAAAGKKSQNQARHDHLPPVAAASEEQPPSIFKKEPSDSDETTPNTHHLESVHANHAIIKAEGEPPPIMFKKRKSKAK